MSLEIILYKAEHAIEIIERQPRQPWLKINAEAKIWAKYLEDIGPAITGLWNGAITGAGGLMFNGPCNRVAEAWCLFGSDVDQELVPVRALWVKEAKKQFDKWIEEYQLVRVEANIIAEFSHGIRFAKFLGMKHESTKLKYYPGEKTGFMYSKIIER